MKSKYRGRYEYTRSYVGELEWVIRRLKTEKDPAFMKELFQHAECVMGARATHGPIPDRPEPKHGC